MAKTKSWEVTDDFWKRVVLLVPPRQPLVDKVYVRKAGGGRKPKDARLVFEGIVYVLRTGCQWKALPKHFGSSSAIHTRFLQWEKAGFFERLWKAGLAEYDDLQGIAWRWQSIDGAMMKAPKAGNLLSGKADAELAPPLAQESVGANPTDRGKKWKQASSAGGRTWRPVIDHRDRGQPA